MGGSRSHLEFFFGKSSQNSPLYQYLYFVFSYYDLSVLSMLVIGFQNKSLDKGVCGWGEPHPVLFWIFGICVTLRP